jgi:hypothetical protein
MSNPRRQSDDLRSQLDQALSRVLIDKIRQDNYPSPTMMDLVEARLDDKLRGEYADALLAKVEADQFPSFDLLRRLAALAG